MFFNKELQAPLTGSKLGAGRFTWQQQQHCLYLLKNAGGESAWILFKRKISLVFKAQGKCNSWLCHWLLGLSLKGRLPQEGGEQELWAWSELPQGWFCLPVYRAAHLCAVTGSADILQTRILIAAWKRIPYEGLGSESDYGVWDVCSCGKMNWKMQIINCSCLGQSANLNGSGRGLN